MGSRNVQSILFNLREKSVLMKLIPGHFYTVKDGRFKGITGIAEESLSPSHDVHVLRSIDFPGDGQISFWKALKSLRKATDKEELAYRRRCDSQIGDGD